ncbi:acyl-CoA dehydrogenase family protein [Inquilinus sp. CA228]|uniref:acyl-CoA dehydrogenase family protein n=1 Tax=Inquilinus sp. CA228 TaxID=3455609 RepID=UPI003F8D3198
MGRRLHREFEANGQRGVTAAAAIGLAAKTVLVLTVCERLNLASSAVQRGSSKLMQILAPNHKREDHHPTGRPRLRPAPEGHFMDISLSARQRRYLTRLGRLCRQRIAPRAAEVDRSASLSARTSRDLAKFGFARLFHPPELGGVGADGVGIALAIETLARACASTAWSATISAALCGKLLHELGTPEHHRRWLRPLIAGEVVGCFGIIGPESGCDPDADRTTLVRNGSRYVLKGEKPWVSNGPIADVGVFTARRRDAPSAGPVHYIVLDLDRPGIHRTTTAHMGLRGMPWGGLRFDDVEVAEEDVIGPVDSGRALDAIGWGHVLQAASAVGIARAALAGSIDFVRERKAFGRPIAHLPAVQVRLADMQAELEAARLLTLDAAWRKGRGQPARDLLMMAKIYASEMAVRVCDAAMRLHAARGYSAEYPIERLYRDALGNIPSGLPNDRLRELVACSLIGADPWSYPASDWLSDAGLKL